MNRIVAPLRPLALPGTLRPFAFSTVLRSALPAVLCLALASVPAAAQSDVPISTQNPEGPPGEPGSAAVMQARFTQDAITLDGMLDEASWQEALPISDFRQHEPVNGAPAFHRTEVRVLYGPDDLYVGALLYDDEPEGIEKALGRRDDFNRADWFLVSLDAYLDRITAYVFGVNAAGVQFDAVFQRGGGVGGGGGGGSNAPRGMDPSWNAVWHSQVRTTKEGWVVEMRIPYAMLRFSEAPAQTWGVHFRRRIPRLGEETEWPLVPRTQRDNLVAQFGLLSGIRDIKPRRNVQIIPYTVTGLHTRESEEVVGELTDSRSVDVGGDLKIGFGPNVTLDATINPDFGQVEADPAVLNLTAFETFFQERRPFFVEGVNIYEFSAGPGRLLYTRRIGANAPIIGAAKLSGRTRSGLSFGVLGGATGSQFTPSRGYGVARIRQQVGSYSTAGAIMTLFDGSPVDDGVHLRSLVAGTDMDLRLLDNRYGIEGFFAASHRNWADAGLHDETGFAGKIWARKRQGAWNGFVGFDVFSDAFDPNDVGQLRENNFMVLLSSVEHEVNGGKPFGPFLRAGARLFFNQQLSYREGLDLGQGIDFGSRWTFRGFQAVRLGLEYENPFSGGYDLYETRGLLPWAKPSSFEVEGDFSTDERRSWQFEPGLEYTFYEDGAREYEVSLQGTWSAVERISLSGEIRSAWEVDLLAWSANETFLRSDAGWFIGKESVPPEELTDADFVALDDGGTLDAMLAGVEPASAGRYYVSVFGSRDTRSADVTLRSTITFTPRLSLQLYSQIFVAKGYYDHFRLHRDRDDLVAFDAYPKRDEFALSSLQSNLVLRWEYRPGSSLFVVWTHGRHAEDVLNPLAPWGISPYRRSLGEQFDTTFDIFPENVFLIKLNYAFLR